MNARGSSWHRRPGSVIAVLGASLGVFSAVTPAALARHKPAKAATTQAAPAAASGPLVQQAVMALAMRDFGKAQRALTTAYRQEPSAETLYLLGVTALSSGDAVGAQDLMRRYLAEVGTGGDAARHAEAQRIAERPRAPSGEVSVIGPPAAFVLVDERLVGRLPLARPLLVATGEHVLAVEVAGVVTSGRVTVGGGQGLEARLSSEGTPTLQVRRLPTVFVASQPALESPPQAATFAALTAAGLAIYDAAAQSGALPPPECAQDRACLLRWAAAQGVQFTLEVATTATPCEVNVRLLDVAIAEAASQRTASCAGEGGVARTLTELLPALLREGIERPRGTLRLTSQPAGAEVMVGSRSLGKTPLVLPRFAEAQDLAVQLAGFRPELRRVVVSAQATTEVQVELTALPPTRSTVLVWQRQRPRWRIALGISAMALGAGLLAAGIPALAIDGTCVQDPVAPVLACERRYATSTVGIGLVVPGAVLLGGGLTALLIPGPRRQVEVPTGGPTTAATTGPFLWGQF